LKNLEELKAYYDRALLPELNVLETERKKVLEKIFMATLVMVAVWAVFIILALKLSDQFAVFAAISGLVVWYAVFAFLTRGYVSNFKTGVIDKIVKFIDDKLVYSKFGKVSQELFSMSRIYNQRIDIYRGDDYVSGMLGRTRVEFSEIHVLYETRDSKGRRHEHTVFKGLFFVGDFNKRFKGNTVVLPDTAEKLLGHVGTFLQSKNPARGQLVKLEDPDFEKLFVVYGNDQIEARYILSTSLMKRIVDFQKKTGRRISLSFVGSRVFVAVPYRRDLFEPRVFRTVLNFAPIQEYYEDLQLAVDIVDDLNLNTRIWTKK